MARPPANDSPVAAGSANVRPRAIVPSTNVYSCTLFCAAPDENTRVPSGLNTRPSHAASIGVVLLTVQLAMSMTVKLGRMTPLLVTTAYLPSGESAMFSGRVLTRSDRPAGATRHPFASSVDPSVSAPGTPVAGAAADCARIRIAEVTTTTSSAANPRTDLRIVAGETTI